MIHDFVSNSTSLLCCLFLNFFLLVCIESLMVVLFTSIVIKVFCRCLAAIVLVLIKYFQTSIIQIAAKWALVQRNIIRNRIGFIVRCFVQPTK